MVPGIIQLRKLYIILSSLLTTLLVFTCCNNTTNAATLMRKPIDYTQSSETVNYPDLSKVHHLNILVIVHQNRVYLRDGNHVIYTIYCSAGVKDPKTGHTTTTLGTYYIQNEHGQSFYNSSLKEGANYWTSFKNHGEYLFHTVPTDAQGNCKPAEAAKLGKDTGSHGCIRLSIPDAKFIQTVPVNTPVKIEE